MINRNIYLNKISLAEAKQKIKEAISERKIVLKQKSECLPVEEARGRITAEAVYARRSALHYAAAAMDGIAVHSQDTVNASESKPVILTHQKDFVYVNTGNPLPEGFDAVIKIEDVIPVEQKSEVKAIHNNIHKKEEKERIQIYQSVFPGLNIRQIGEDIVTHQLILPVNHKIRPIDIGALLAGGVISIRVRKKPRVAIIPTGEELRSPAEEELKAGEIVDFNSRMLSGYVLQWGGEPIIYPVIGDREEELKKTIQSAIEEDDIITVIAGTSAGSKDFTAQVLGELGETLFHGVAIMPGKPTIVGVIKNTPLIGLPGYPVSFLIAAWEFVLPLVCWHLGIPSQSRKIVKAMMSRKVVSKLGNEEFLRVKLAQIDNQLIAYPLSRGAGNISSLLEADALVRIPALSEGLSFKEEVEAELLEENEENANFDNSIIIIGSHDLILDVLRNELQAVAPEFRLASFHTGSMGGLLALKQEIAHIATSHLFDVPTGEYNFPYLRRLLPEHNLVVVNMAYREQGLIVARGNPKGIQGIPDLTRKDVRYINRQKGSGTRVLLDYLISKENINPADINGYQQEEFTHLMVASAVANYRADAGLGIYSAASAFGLDFIPLIKERYDLIIPEQYFQSKGIQKMLEIIGTEHFQEQVGQLGGYDLSQCGKILTYEKNN